MMSDANANNENQGSRLLPASIEAAWGVRSRPTKGPKPGLSLERIVVAAIKIALTKGLSAVSMSRVATELGSAPMSLYRYVASKDELLALMVDAALGPPLAAPSSDDGWRAALSRWAWGALAAYRRHPWTLQIPISGPPATPNQVAWLEQGLRALRGTGLTEAEKLSVVMLLAGIVRNEASLEASISAAFQASGATPEEAMSSYGRLLRRVASPERFPALCALIAAGVLDAVGGQDDEFLFGLARILDGIEVLIRTRTSGQAEPHEVSAPRADS